MCLTVGPPPPWYGLGEGGSAFVPPKDMQSLLAQHPMNQVADYQMGLHQGYEGHPFGSEGPSGGGRMMPGIGAPLNSAGPGGGLGADYLGGTPYQDYQNTTSDYQYCSPYPDTSGYYPAMSYQHQQRSAAPTPKEPCKAPATPPSSGYWWPSGTQDQDRFMRPAPPSALGGQPKRKRRNSEKRKEKSRDAARCRRGKESEIFNELAEMLPMPQSIVAQLDKASIMRLALAFLKTRALHNASQKASGGALSDTVLKCEDEDEQESKLSVEAKLCMEDSFLKTLDGFVLIVSGDTDVVYTSENIQEHLGLPQVDVMGNSLLDYAHPCDHAEVQELVSPKGQSHRHYFIRLKCTLTQKGRNVNLKSATYKVCQISGKMITGKAEKDNWVVATASPVPHPSNIEFPLDKQAFVSKHSLDMKFTYVDDNIAEFMGYECEELVGRSLYEMNHAEDSQLLKNIYKILCEKGQVETPRYRFLARGGGYVWLVTQATLINGPKGDKQPQYVVCINYVASGIENPGCILSSMQLAAAPSCAPVKRIPTSPVNGISDRVSNCEVSPPPLKLLPQPILPRIEVADVPKVVVENVGIGLEASPITAAPVQRQTRPQRSTSKIFTRRTEEMTKGYLIFSKDDPQKTVLKEEPDDLTHLAPCMPHDETTPVFSDYGHIGNPSVGRDRTTSVPVSSTLNILKPISSIVSTCTGSYPRSSTASIICSKNNPELEAKVPPDNSFYSNSNSTSIMNMDEEDMEARAPYIPLCDEMLLLGPDDHMWDTPNDCNSYDAPSARYSKNTESSGLQEDSNLAKLLRDIDPTLIGGTGIKRKPSKSIGQPNGQHNKFLEENSFVDPNKVLPVFGGDPVADVYEVEPGGQLFNGYGSGTTVVMSNTDTPPPPLVGDNEIDTPPPLASLHQFYAGVQRVNSKRVVSPAASPVMAHKRICCSPSMTSYSQQQQQQQQQRGTMQPLLPVPYAPTMQQLLVPPNFKPNEPPHENQITGNSPQKSVLIEKRAIVHDQSGRRVFLTHQTGGNIFIGNNCSSKDYIDCKGVADICSNKGSTNSCPQPIAANSDQQLEANRRLIAMRISQRRTTSGGHTPLHLITNCSYNSSYNNNQDYLKSLIGCNSVAPVWRQDLTQLTDPNFSIPNLSDLTQQDYDVNAPTTTNHLLQGPELIRALEHPF